MYSAIKIRCLIAGILGGVISCPVLGAQLPQRTVTPAPAPTLIDVSSDGCFTAGQKIRVNGRILGSQSKYQLVFIQKQQQSILKSEQWLDTTISAKLPANLPAESTAVLVLRDIRSKQFVSNRLSLQLCVNTDSQPLRSSDQSAGPREGSVPVETSTYSNPASGGGLIQPTERNTPQTSVKNDANVEAQEFIVYSQDMDAARELDNKLQELGYSTKRRRVLKQLGLVISVIHIPAHEPVTEALQKLQEIDSRLLADANHRYQLMRKEEPTVPSPQQVIKWKQTSRCGKQVRLGLIDTLVDNSHPALAGSKIVSKSFLPLGVPSANKRHATAIASILIGRSDEARLSGLLPGAQLYNAAIFRRLPHDQVDTTAELIITALDWMLTQHVHAINLSLTGSANRLLQLAVENSLAQNQIIVAAAGNNGPTAGPLYPAAWQDVVAVTAVDSKAQVYRQANRGSYIDFAAPGVDIWAARAGGGWAYHSGTSFAAPYVTAALAVLRQHEPQAKTSKLVALLGAQASDLGEAGKDPVFGHGLLQFSTACK